MGIETIIEYRTAGRRVVRLSGRSRLRFLKERNPHEKCNERRDDITTSLRTIGQERTRRHPWKKDFMAFETDIDYNPSESALKIQIPLSSSGTS